MAKTMSLLKAIIIVALLYSVLLLSQNTASSRELEPGTKMHGPSKNPPRVQIPGYQVDEKIMPKIPFRATPDTEWTFHKTLDNAHPDANEQQMLWLMNRARANPTQEGIWLATTDISNIANARTYFSVNVVLLQSEFASYASKPPAAFDVRLYNAAKVHSDDLIARDAQDHTNQFQRISDAGFSYLQARGNVFSYNQDAVYGHAAFNIDWGSGTDGMQDGRGHRMAIMSIDGDYTNVGIAIVSESDPATNVGPLVTTGNYCKADTSQPNHYNRFIVGTVWNDLDSDGMYDPGEGVGNVTVMPNSGMYYAVTSNSGGYAIPIDSPGTYTLTFSGAVDAVRTVTVGAESVLLDDAFTAATSFSLPMTENFDAATLPTGWTTQNIGTGITECWSVSSSNSAGASAYEMKCSRDTVNPGTTRLITPAINTAGIGQITLSFRHFFRHYPYGAYPTLRVQTSNDKSTWTDTSWSIATSLFDIGPATVTVPITTNLNSSTTYLAFVVDGNLSGFDYWYIDNVSIRSAILHVSKDGNCGGKRPCYTTIQSAVNAAEDGDTIKVSLGSYNEGPVRSAAGTVTLSGGWNSNFTSRTGETEIYAPGIAGGGGLKLRPNVRVIHH